MGSDLFLGSEPHNAECFAGKEVGNEDDRVEPIAYQDCPKYHGNELRKINLAGEGKQAQLFS